MHHLTIEPNRRLVKQAPMRMHPNLATKVEAKVDKLVTASFISEVQYSIWLAQKEEHADLGLCRLSGP